MKNSSDILTFDESVKLNNIELIRKRIREEHAKWIASKEPDYLITLTFRTNDRTLNSAKKYVNGLMNKLRRNFFGRQCVKFFFRSLHLKAEFAAVAFFEKHAEGGYHVHMLLSLPKNPNFEIENFENHLKRIWTKMTKAYVTEIVKSSSFAESKKYADYSAKNFGKGFHHDDQVDYYSWNKLS